MNTIGNSQSCVIKERPILMHARSIEGILAGRKMQTRRIVKPQPLPDESIVQYAGNSTGWLMGRLRDSENAWRDAKCPYGKPGERLWVRETWQWFGRILRPGEVEGGFSYRADGAQRRFEQFDAPDKAWEMFKAAGVEGRWNKWIPSIHMPRWASRLTLEITDIRVERVQDISEEDCKAEGIEYPEADPRDIDENLEAECGYFPPSSFETAFERLWNETNGKGAWERNDWVFAISFRRIP